MREKLKKMMWGEPTGEYIPNTIAEYAIMRNIFETMPEISVAEPVCFDGIRDGKRNTEVQASLYDAMLAEILGEHDAEKAKVRDRRKADRKYKELPKERKFREEMRKDRLFGYYGNYDCPKVRFAPDSEPIKTRKYAEGDRIIRADYQREFDNDAESEYRAERFRKSVWKEKDYRDSVARMMDKRIQNLTEIAEKLKKMEDPTTWEELDDYHDNVEMAYWYMRD